MTAVEPAQSVSLATYALPFPIWFVIPDTHAAGSAPCQVQVNHIMCLEQVGVMIYTYTGAR